MLFPDNCECKRKKIRVTLVAMWTFYKGTNGMKNGRNGFICVYRFRAFQLQSNRWFRRMLLISTNLYRGKSLRTDEHSGIFKFVVLVFIGRNAIIGEGCGCEKKNCKSGYLNGILNYKVRECIISESDVYLDAFCNLLKYKLTHTYAHFFNLNDLEIIIFERYRTFQLHIILKLYQLVFRYGCR